jgi:hypothetical protein
VKQARIPTGLCPARILMVHSVVMRGRIPVQIIFLVAGGPDEAAFEYRDGAASVVLLGYWRLHRTDQLACAGHRALSCAPPPAASSLSPAARRASVSQIARKHGIKTVENATHAPGSAHALGPSDGYAPSGKDYMMRYDVMALTIMGVLSATPVQAACSRPSAPVCATQTGAFAGLQDFDECRMRMLAYRDATDAYAACVKEEALPSQEEQSARDEFEDIRTRFNRRARGE